MTDIKARSCPTAHAMSSWAAHGPFSVWQIVGDGRELLLIYI